MTNGFRSRYQELMLDAPIAQVESRLATANKVSRAVGVRDVLPLVQLILGLDGSEARTAIEEACAQSEPTQLVTGPRELRFLAIEIARQLLDGKPQRPTDALGLALVTSSWDRSGEDDIKSLTDSAIAYLVPRQSELRRPLASPPLAGPDSYQKALEASTLSGSNGPVTFGQIEPLLSAMHSHSIEQEKRMAANEGYIRHYMRVVDERTSVIALCLSRYSESCDALYSDLGATAPLAAAYDLSNVTKCDLGFRAARYYIKAMLGSKVKSVSVGQALEHLPERVSSVISDQALASSITPIMAAVHERAARAARIEQGVALCLQLYNELLLSKMIKHG